MTRYKVTIAYDGHRYQGFQKQINAHGIQSEIEKALSKLLKTQAVITAAGRTDAGVHALGQVFHFDGPSSIGCRGYYNALNTLLPKDIRVLRVQQEQADFHARFSSVRKVYEYVMTSQQDNPFIEHYKTRLKRPLDLQAIRDAIPVLLGTHDFTSLSNAQIDPCKSRIKTIERIDVLTEGSDIRFVFEADGFLRYQVRMMSAALIAIGEHKLDAAGLQAILEAKDKHACRFNAPAQGLYLREVVYPKDNSLSECWPPQRDLDEGAVKDNKKSSADL